MSTTPSRPGVSAMLPRTSGLEPAALWTLFTLTLRGFLRGKRAIVLIVLSLLPAGLTLVVRSIDHEPPKSVIEFLFLFNLIPHALLPLTALLYGTGMILDEQEEQTLTYLLIRPLPKWALYVTKLLATMCMVALLGVVFVVMTFTAVYIGAPEFWEVFPLKILETLAVMVLAMATYVAVFGCLSLLVQRSLIVGIIYIVAIEGIMANLDFAVRKLTVMYYFRVLSLHWLNVNPKMSAAWQIKLTEAPEALMCVFILMVLSVLATLLAASVFSRKEFYVKTPEST